MLPNFELDCTIILIGFPSLLKISYLIEMIIRKWSETLGFKKTPQTSMGFILDPTTIMGFLEDLQKNTIFFKGSPTLQNGIKLGSHNQNVTIKKETPPIIHSCNVYLAFFSINSLCEQNHDWFIISLFYAIWDNFSWFCLIKYTWILVHWFLQIRGNIIHLFPHHLFEFGVLVHILYYRFICTKLQITLVRVWTAYTKSWISFHPHNEIECFTNQNKVDLTLYHLQQMDHQMGTNITRKGHRNQTSFLLIKVRII